MPGQNNSTGAELNFAGLASHVTQKLGDIGAHRVIGKVMLNTPQRVEPQRFSQLGDFKFGVIDSQVGHIAGVLEEHVNANVHKSLLS